jgi:hypothetical protein
MGATTCVWYAYACIDHPPQGDGWLQLCASPIYLQSDCNMASHLPRGVGNASAWKLLAFDFLVLGAVLLSSAKYLHNVMICLL